MKLLIDPLTETPSDLAFSASASWWRESAHLAPEIADLIEEPIEFRLAVHRMGADVYLEGTAEGALDLTCSRCVARYREPIRERFRLVLEPAGHRVPAEPEGAATLARDGLWLSDELESGWFRGTDVDLGGFLQEVVALLVRVQPLCRESCQGLCPVCGADRNTTSCDCEEAGGNSPFAVLQGLRDQLGGGEKS